MISITLTYLCQTAVCWAVMLVFYELFLRKSTHYHLSRLYLISALILGAIIPLLPNYFTQAPEFVYSFQGSLEEFVVVVDSYTAPQIEQTFDWTVILQSFYITISALMLFRIAFGVYKITMIKPIRKTKHGVIEVNFHQENIQPFSFLNKIFIPKDYPEKYQQIVLAHEMSHVKQGHSIDIIISRTMAAVFWVNPMVRFFERYLKEVHEHFADQHTLANYDLKTYQGALRFSAFSSVGLRMAHAFNSNNIRKRLRKMKRSNSTLMTKFLYVAILPIAVFLSMAMNTYDGDVLKSALNDLKENTGKLLTSSTGLNGALIDTNQGDTIPPPPPPPPPYPPVVLGNRIPAADGPSLHDLLGNDAVGLNDAGSKGIKLKNNFNDVLIIVDGKDMGVAGSLPYDLYPNEIESIDVLKDEKATALYGKRGANGVLLIRRKKGAHAKSTFPGPHPVTVTSSAVPPPPPPPPSPPAFLKENLLYTTADEKPRFPGCENIGGSVEEKEKCATMKMIEFLGSQIKYPESAKKYGVDGVVIIQFTVTLEGKIRDAIISRDIGHGCGEEALRVVNIMNQEVGMWVPGKKNGEAVHVQFNLPIKFKMEGDRSLQKETPGPIRSIADVMPRFPGCEELPNNAMEACSKKNLLTYIYKNIKYPEQAKANNIEGMVVVEFVVTTDGSLDKIKLFNDIGGGCGEESVRVVALMNTEGIRWEPGVHKGEPVNVKYTLPINFKLENKLVQSDYSGKQEGDVFKIVEQKPMFPGCDDMIGTLDEKEKCATKLMLEFLYKNIKYPEAAKTNGVQGTTIVQFVVEKDGSLSGMKIVRPVKYGCSEEALRVVQLMNNMEEKWTPGRQAGQAVRVQYNLPIKFKLSDDSENNVTNPQQSHVYDQTGDDVFKIVEQKPRFPGCEDVVGTRAEKEKCATKNMLEFLYSNIKYPETAKANGTEGTTVVQFVVEKDGTLSGAKVVRAVQDGCSEESLRVVNLMNQMEENWTPGMQRGQAVRVQYNLPIKFKLSDDSENKVIGEF